MDLKIQLLVLCMSVLVIRSKSYVLVESQDISKDFLQNQRALDYFGDDSGFQEVIDYIYNTHDLFTEESPLEKNLKPLDAIGILNGYKQVKNYDTVSTSKPEVTPVDEPKIVKRTTYQIDSIINGGHKCPIGYIRQNGICMKEDPDYYDYTSTTQ